MLTGNQYRESLRDGRKSFFEGKLVEDAAAHRLFGISADWVAKTYDRYHSTDAGATNPMYKTPTTAAELAAQMDFLLNADPTASSTAGSMALRAVAHEIGELNPAYRANLERFLDRLRDEDLRVAVAQDDLSSFRVVSRNADGVIVSGGKQHVVGGALVHELFVVPSKAVGADEKDRAIAFAIPVNAPGIKLISTTTQPRAHDDRHFPYSRDHSIPDSLVAFENVFVPNDRIFLNGEVAHSGTFSETLGIWERARSTAVQADQAEILLGVARTVAEMNGVADASHIRDKLSAMAVYARLCRAGWEAALANAQTNAAGMVVPDDSYIYATRAYGVTNYSEMAGWVHDIGGALILTAPAVADYENEATRMYVEKYMSTGATVRGEDRMRIFHLIRDLTADTYSGWSKLNNQMIGGGLFAQRLSALDTYPMDHAKSKASSAAHITD
ncbi:MAG: 4-hydroxyphenylacetate 3-hydroxylase [Dehalococcoidia bacterium]|nr:4-hydroxyphenylacetate 3-hydroxylase [Dehalococcoidia bacterium]